MSDSEFAVLSEELLAGAAKTSKKSKGKASGGKKKLPKDSPVARVSAVLSERGFSGPSAQEWLARALVRDGIDPALIPIPQSDDVELWLTELFRKVSSAVVFDVARNAQD